jgi:hypothetical protein
MAPPPTTTNLGGMASKAIASSEETTVCRSNGKKESSVGTEPEAMTMFLAAIV